MLASIAIPFFTIALAEFFDKSQLTIFLLATRTKHHASLFLGVMIAFLIVDGTAVIFGSVITSLIPIPILKLVSGSLFIFFGILTLLQPKGSKNKPVHLTTPLRTGFTLVFLSEWGDKTQLASLLFATRFHPILVFLGVISALALLSLSTIFAGKMLKELFGDFPFAKISGIIFILLGLIFIIT